MRASQERHHDLGLGDNGLHAGHALDGQDRSYGSIIELGRLGMRPLVYGVERRPREWARRVSGLGGDRSEVVYVTPTDLGRMYASKPLWDSAHVLGDIAKASDSDIVLVDSMLPASGVGEERLRTEAQAPSLHVAALDALGIPSVSFGHPPKGQAEGDPFGSMAWVAAMRLTNIGTRAEGERGKGERGSGTSAAISPMCC